MSIDFKMKGKNILLYGGHSNIGRYATLEFAKEGANVTIAARDIKSAERVIGEALEAGAQNAQCIKCDATNYEETAAAADLALKYGGIDCVYHGVSWNMFNHFPDLPREHWQKIYEINFKSVMNAWHYILPIMKEQGYGNFVNNASVMGRQHGLDEPVYGAMKSALIHLAQTLALEYAQYHIRINLIAPGPTPPPDDRYTSGSPWHEFFKQGDVLDEYKKYSPLNQYGHPSECGSAVIYLASEVTGRHLTGQIIGLDGGWYLPK
jgi:NAD(P)-dependent dehydrogenase (short-subunit alcohol dehydrogenase family)